MNSTQQDIFTAAVNIIAEGMGKPKLFGANNKPLKLPSPIGNFQFRRDSGGRMGSLKNWTPSMLGSNQAEAYERNTIVERSIDLVNNNPDAAGIIDSFAVSVIGSGLTPHPVLDGEALGLNKKKISKLQAQQKTVWDEWTPYADAGGRLSFGGIQFLAERSMLVYGESIILLPMLDDLTRPLSLACQLINPLRLRTPTDLQNQDNIIDGVEIGEHGEIVALWIKKSGPASGYSTSNTSENYLRLPIKQGHRWNVLYRFDAKDPEQVNGYPILTPAMKKFKDLNDFLDSELVSSIVTAAFSLFVQVPEGIDPSVYASVFAGIEESGMNPDGSTKIDRFQELDPGAIMYGNPGEKPFPIAANRPGTTFEPFIKIIRQAIAQAVGLPYVIAFKDVDSANFAGFRSAMLDAWKLFLFRRNNAGLEAQKIYTMVQEEGFLRGRIKVKNFYLHIHALTKCDWRGAPKGDIEPVKAIQADILAIDAKLKTRAEAITERTNAGDWRTTFAQLADEEEVLKEQGISDAPEQKTEIQKDDNQEEQDPGEKPGQSNPDK